MPTLEPHQISVIIPVKDNQSGIEQLLHNFLKRIDVHYLPLEILIVDDGSRNPVYIPYQYKKSRMHIKVIRSSVTRNRSGARNLGAKLARGQWILFVDSDCIPVSDLISGYLKAYDGKSMAYAGATYSLSADPLSKFYDNFRVFIPPPASDGRPLYIITANAMVSKEAFLQVNGFDERFFTGEDLDLSFRMVRQFPISYALDSVVHHDMSDGFIGFIERFYRYGSGSKLLEDKYDTEKRGAFVPLQHTYQVRNGSFDRLMLTIRYMCEMWGFLSCSLNELQSILKIDELHRIQEHDARVVLSGLASEIESQIGKNRAQYRGMPVRELAGFSMTVLKVIGAVHPELKDAFAPRFLELKSSCLY